jgi:hypothetical protein
MVTAAFTIFFAFEPPFIRILSIAGAAALTKRAKT